MSTQAEYMREYRRKNPAKAHFNRLASNARTKALEQLADLHPQQFATLLDEARLSNGLPKVGTLPKGRPPQ